MEPTNPENPDGANDGRPDQEDQNSSLNRTGKLFGGLVADIRRKAPWYVSDFRDGLHVQCLASAFLIYCGCLTTMVTFGSLLGMITNNNIGIVECLGSYAICGITYHLFCGQPLTILSSTGPMFVFESIVYNVCLQYGLSYLSFRFWIGFWICVIFLIIVAFDLSFLVRYVTRFTQECFTALLAFIVIYEASSKHFEQGRIWHSMRSLDSSCACQFDGHTGFTESALHTVYGDETTATSNWMTRQLDLVSSFGDCQRKGGRLVGSGCAPQLFTPEFLFSLFLFLGTFLLLLLLKLLKKTRFLPLRVRTCISDLAIFAVVVLMVLIDAAVGFSTVKLRIPFAFEMLRNESVATSSEWIVDPLRNHSLCILFAIPPAILAAILMFIDHHFPAVIISRKERKLKKGSGFHLDLLIIAFQIILCSAFGCPWFVGATVLSINHIHSLTVTTEPSAPGEPSAFLGIREQRVTGILASLLIGGSVFSTQVLKFVPMSVLYGILLYMGVAALQGMQFVNRVLFLFKRRGCFARPVFWHTISTGRVCLFTFIQIVCFAVACVVKRIQLITLLFPLTVVVMCVVRKVLERVFTYDELLKLDDILPGSKRERTENRTRTENMDGLELQQVETSRMMPTAPDVTTSSRPTAMSDDLPDTLPPSYDMVIRQTK